MSSKIVNLDQLTKLLKKHYGSKNIGVITGCFDVLHTGHVDLFHFAKNSVDILVIGIDTDEAIKKTKGERRPINTQIERAKMLAALTHIDYVLLFTSTYEFNSHEANKYYDELIWELRPTHLITGGDADLFWSKKRNRIEKVGGILLVDKKKRSSSTSEVVNKILKLG